MDWARNGQRKLEVLFAEERGKGCWTLKTTNMSHRGLFCEPEFQRVRRQIHRVSGTGRKNKKLHLKSWRKVGFYWRPWRCRQALRPKFCPAFFPQVLAGSKAREERYLLLGEQVARQSPKVSGCNPTWPSRGKAGMLTRSQESGGLAGPGCPGLAGRAFCTLSPHSTICSCRLHLAQRQRCQSLQGIAGPSASKTWERPNLTLGCSPWS